MDAARIAMLGRALADLERHYVGPHPLRVDLTDAEAVETAWLAWSRWVRSFRQILLASVAGYKPLDLIRKIDTECDLRESEGARHAMRVYWQGPLARDGVVLRHGPHAFSQAHLDSLADDKVNRDLFRLVESELRRRIEMVIRDRRAFLDGEGGDPAKLAQDMPQVLGAMPPPLLTARQRSENLEGALG